MTDLSPAARAVLDAACESLDRRGCISDQVAAALRAMADHIYHDWSGFNCVDALCEVAAEIEQYDD